MCVCCVNIILATQSDGSQELWNSIFDGPTHKFYREIAYFLRDLRFFLEWGAGVIGGTVW